jgi:quercetin dioxygenase-like cupin family protein
MELKRNGSQPSSYGTDENFTGKVRVDPLFEAPNPARIRGASVTFEPGARSAWHTHPLGQILIVTSGCGWVQSEGSTKSRNSSGRRRLVSAERGGIGTALLLQPQ